MTARQKTQYFLLTLIYVLAWTLMFSHLERNGFLILGLLAAAAYGAGQIYEWMFRGHLGVSADPSALTAAALTTAIATAALVAFGKLPAGSVTWLEVGVRFFQAFAAGHLCGFGSAFLMDRLWPGKSG